MIVRVACGAAAVLALLAVVWSMARLTLAGAPSPDLPRPEAEPDPGPALRYPDLRVVAPDDLVLGVERVGGGLHHVVRFSTVVWNGGEGPLELRGENTVAGAPVYQRVHGDPGVVVEYLAGVFTYHEGHQHWHFENFARYELWTGASFDRWLASDRLVGQPEWQGSKTTGQGESFCVRDSSSMPGVPAAPFRYAECDREVQGISVGWSDIYARDLPDQWVDVGLAPLPDGDYVLRIVADPLNLIHESPGRADPTRESHAANEALTQFTIANGAIAAVRPARR